MKIDIRRVALDFFLYLVVLVPLSLSLAGIINVERGHFTCNDLFIKLERRPDSVSTKLLLLILFLPIIFIVFVTEFFHCPRGGTRTKLATAAQHTVQVYIRYFVASTLNIAVNDIMKVLTAVPRPHFIHTCQPDWSRINCSHNSGYVDFSRDICLSEDTKSVFDAMKSFPSGHAQLTAFTSVFIAIYIEKRIGEKHSFGLKRLLQLIIFVLPVWSGSSRIQDQRHHVADVVVGYIIGGFLGFVTSVGLFLEENVDKSTDSSSQKDGREESEERYQKTHKAPLLSQFRFGSLVERERELKDVNPAC